MSQPRIPFVDLAAEYRLIQTEVDAAVNRVLQSGQYILGPEVAAFEAEFAAFCGVGHAVGVASGTDALLLALLALGVEPGDEVITVAHTAVATVRAIQLAGARPVFADIDPLSSTLDPEHLPGLLTPRTRVILPVHLYGHPADLLPILTFARQHGLALLEDCAQAHGAQYHGRPVGSWGDAAAFSFYPTKNLGAVGDGGAVVTDRPDVAERLRLLRQYGWRERYVSEIPGYNSRLDELQAAILRVKLCHLPAWNERRRTLAGRYGELLRSLPLELPLTRPGSLPVYHLYVVQTPDRQELRAALKAVGVTTAVHYAVPVHLQPAYHFLTQGRGTLPLTEAAAARVLSLPFYPHFSDQDMDAVAGSLLAFWR